MSNKILLSKQRKHYSAEYFLSIIGYSEIVSEIFIENLGFSSRIPFSLSSSIKVEGDKIYIYDDEGFSEFAIDIKNITCFKKIKDKLIFEFGKLKVTVVLD